MRSLSWCRWNVDSPNKTLARHHSSVLWKPQNSLVIRRDELSRISTLRLPLCQMFSFPAADTQCLCGNGSNICLIMIPFSLETGFCFGLVCYCWCWAWVSPCYWLRRLRSFAERTAFRSSPHSWKDTCLCALGFATTCQFVQDNKDLVLTESTIHLVSHLCALFNLLKYIPIS